AAGIAGDFQARQFLLGALHLFLHLLCLLHQLGNVSAHFVAYSSWGRMVSGTRVAPYRWISCCTPGSAMNAASAASWRASRLRSLRSCRVSPAASATVSNCSCGVMPSPGASALARALMEA